MSDVANLAILAVVMRERAAGVLGRESIRFRGRLGLGSGLKDEKEPRKRRVDLDVGAFGPQASAGLQ
jgi:hypothetical protein